MATHTRVGPTKHSSLRVPFQKQTNPADKASQGGGNTHKSKRACFYLGRGVASAIGTHPRHALLYVIMGARGGCGTKKGGR